MEFGQEFGYVGIVLVTEINMYMYKKLLVLHHLILPKGYVAHFADQLLQCADQIFENCRPTNK